MPGCAHVSSLSPPSLDPWRQQPRRQSTPFQDCARASSARFLLLGRCFVDQSLIINMGLIKPLNSRERPVPSYLDCELSSESRVCFSARLEKWFVWNEISGPGEIPRRLLQSGKMAGLYIISTVPPLETPTVCSSKEVLKRWAHRVQLRTRSRRLYECMSRMRELKREVVPHFAKKVSTHRFGSQSLNEQYKVAMGKTPHD